MFSLMDLLSVWFKLLSHFCSFHVSCSFGFKAVLCSHVVAKKVCFLSLSGCVNEEFLSHIKIITCRHHTFLNCFDFRPRFCGSTVVLSMGSICMVI